MTELLITCNRLINKKNIHPIKNLNISLNIENSNFLFDNEGECLSDQFYVKDNKLSIIDDTNTYAYYDCSNSRTFKK